MASLPSSLRNRNGFSSMRFLGVLKQQESPTTGGHNGGAGLGRHEDGGSGEDRVLELEESDVVWSPACFSDQSESHSPVDSAGPNSPLSTASTCRSASSLSPSGNQVLQRHFRDGHGRRSGHHFTPERFGLSAALVEEPGLLVQQRKPSFDPSASATIAVRTVPPIPALKPEAGSDGYSSGQGNLFGQSAPMNVPAWPRKGLRPLGERAPNEEDDWDKDRAWEDKDKGEMVPPHLIVARSHSTTFSVFEGVGRTLKGRDLRRVRNAVFQKTGFLE
ncbi:unnamed protein product [Spirodela intermedia]|uniref:Uncharacterized protein n=1 Tax=Spirodela intermedia TaxID=51605 RepID=A0A7I8K471_SPIIN|nr:unnamed protein product [Spirodela intermedia]